MRERSLIVFTLLAQMAAGAFLAAGVLHAGLARWAGVEIADLLTDKILWGIGPIIGLSLLASFFHLGTPTHAWRAFTNLRTSWLSREILFTTLFAVTGGMFAGLQWLKLGPLALRSAAAWTAALMGLLMIYCMSRVYMLRTVPAWNSPFTPVSFFLTALLLGNLVVGLALVLVYTNLVETRTPLLAYQYPLLQRALQWIGFSTLILLSLEFLTILLGVAQLAAGSQAALEAIRKWVHPYGHIFTLRLVLTLVGAGLGGLLLYQNVFFLPEIWLRNLIAPLALGLTLAGEILGRFLFYEMRSEQGL